MFWQADGRILSIEYRGSGSHYFTPTSGNRASNYDALREQADRERRERRKIAEPQTQDARNGFSEAKGQQLYSDRMMVDAPTVPVSKRGRGFRWSAVFSLPAHTMIRKIPLCINISLLFWSCWVVSGAMILDRSSAFWDGLAGHEFICIIFWNEQL
jgi:hypothetical protein